MKILAIETSCDDTGVAIIETDGKNRQKLLADFLSSQIKIHAPYGGVVPTLAKREHQKNLVPVLKKTLKKAGLLKNHESRIMNQELNLNSKFLILNSVLDREPELLRRLSPFLKQYAKPDIDAIAVTIGPGLEPALWVGVNFARALAYFWNLPIIPVNHIEGHIAANWLTPIGGNSKLQILNPKQNPKLKIQNYTNRQPLVAIRFPILCLVVSGGHTQLVLIEKFNSHGRNSHVFPLSYAILGETRDDAAGEALDKLAKMLNLGYPGGPIIAKLATGLNSPLPPLKIRGGSPSLDSREGWGEFNTVKFPRPMINTKDYDFSFSGLKTAALYFIKTLNKKTLKKLTPAICAEFQQAIVDVLVKKTIRAAKEFKVKTIMLAGGVAANKELRKQLKEKVKKEIHNSLFIIPDSDYCTDNAAMIAGAAAFKIKTAKKSWRDLKAEANLRLK